MTTLSLNQAAKEADVAKSTLLKAIRSGRMTAPKGDKGHYEIDPAELFRVYPKKVEEPPKENAGNLQETEGYKRENALLRDQIEELKNDRDEWREQAKKSGNLLEGMTQQKQQTAKKGFLARLFGE